MSDDEPSSVCLAVTLYSPCENQSIQNPAFQAGQQVQFRPGDREAVENAIYVIIEVFFHLGWRYIVQKLRGTQRNNATDDAKLTVDESRLKLLDET